MKKILLALTMVTGLSALNAQTEVWSDNFDDLDVSDWVLYDEDGDGQMWYAAQLTDDGGNPTGTPILTSVSWNGSALTPDNWAVSPAIDLTGITGAELKWFIFASDPLWNLENYGVYVATENTVEAFTTAGELFTEFDLPSELTERTLDISAFDGQTIYVAFRHYDVSDQFRIGLDDVSVSGTEGGGGEYCTPLPMDCSDGDVILNVTFAGIDNDSDCSPDGYGDYTSLAPAQVVAGETYDVEMEIGAGWYEKVSLWIDFDNSMTFDEAERFDVVEGDTGGVMVGSVTIPADAAEGTFRMRFFLGAVGSDNPYPADPCNTNDQGFGEIEDYMIEVGTMGIGDVNSSITAVYPNPVVDTFQVNLSSKFNANQVSVTVTDLSGKTVKSFGNQTSYNVSELPKGVYVVKITDGKNVETKKIVKK